MSLVSPPRGMGEPNRSRRASGRWCTEHFLLAVELELARGYGAAIGLGAGRDAWSRSQRGEQDGRKRQPEAWHPGSDLAGGVGKRPDVSVPGASQFRSIRSPARPCGSTISCRPFSDRAARSGSGAPGKFAFWSSNRTHPDGSTQCNSATAANSEARAHPHSVPHELSLIHI